LNKNKSNRTYRIEFYVNEKEYKEILKKQSQTRLTKSALMRNLIMGLDIRPKPTEKIIEIYRLVANIANNTNQIAKIANATGYVDPIKINGLLTIVDKCWLLMKKII